MPTTPEEKRDAQPDRARRPVAKVPTLFVDLAWASRRVTSTRARLQKKAFMVDALSRVPADEIEAAVGWLVEAPLCGPLGVGPAHLFKLADIPLAKAPSLTLREVEESLQTAKNGARDEVLAHVTGLYEKLTEPERALFTGALTGSLRQGSLGGVMLLALSDLSQLSEEIVRRSVMLCGSISAAAAALLGENVNIPSALKLFTPLAPMLASPAGSLDEAFGQNQGACIVEWKVDGLRAQIHKNGDHITIFSRQGNDITAGCASVIPQLTALPAESAVLDGEVVLVDANDVAKPFQDTFSAIASKRPLRSDERLRVYVFDCIHRDGRDLLDEPLHARRAHLFDVVPPAMQMPAENVESVEQAKLFQQAALAAGHEGIMLKELASAYRFGARGHAWQKIKEFTTVDLVVLAAEWGSGRRTGLLSNLHLGARLDDGTFCMVGKTFKGLTDVLLRWQTEHLQALATETSKYVVHVQPKLVVEIRFNDVLRSSRYPGRVALRFARVVRYREDKLPSECDTLASLIARLPDAADRENAAKAARTVKAKKPVLQLSLFDK